MSHYLYTEADLKAESTREELSSQFQGKCFEMQVTGIKENFCLLTHPDFERDIRCPSFFFGKEKPGKGEICKVEIKIQQNKKGVFCYHIKKAARTGEIRPLPEREKQESRDYGKKDTGRTDFHKTAQAGSGIRKKIADNEFYTKKTQFFTDCRMGADEALFSLFFNKALTNLCLKCGLRVQGEFKPNSLTARIGALDDDENTPFSAELKDYAQFISSLAIEASTPVNQAEDFQKEHKRLLKKNCSLFTSKIAILRNFFSHCDESLPKETIQLDTDLYIFLGKMIAAVQSHCTHDAQVLARFPLFRKVTIEESPKKYKSYFELTKAGMTLLCCMALYKDEAEEFCSQMSDMRSSALFAKPLQNFFTSMSFTRKRQLLDMTDSDFIAFADIMTYLNKVPSPCLENLSLNGERARLKMLQENSQLSDDHRGSKFLLYERAADKFTHYALCVLDDFQFLPHLTFKHQDPNLKYTRNPYVFSSQKGLDPHERLYTIENGSAQFEWHFPESGEHRGCVKINTLRGVLTESVLQQMLYLTLDPAGLKLTAQVDRLADRWLSAYHALLEIVLDRAQNGKTIDPELFMPELSVLTGLTPDDIRKDLSEQPEKSAVCKILGPRLVSFFEGTKKIVPDIKEEIGKKAVAALNQDRELAERYRKEKISDALMIRQVFRFFNLILEKTPWQFRQLPQEKQHRGWVDYEYQTVHALLGKFTLNPKALWKHFEKTAEKCKKKDFCAVTLFSACEAMDYCNSRNMILEKSRTLKRAKTLEELSFLALQEVIREDMRIVNGLREDAVDPVEKTEYPNLMTRFGIRKQNGHTADDLFRSVLKIDRQQWARAFDYRQHCKHENRSLTDAEELIVPQILIPDDLLGRLLDDPALLPKLRNDPAAPWNAKMQKPDIKNGISKIHQPIALRDYYDVSTLVQWLKVNAENRKNKSSMPVSSTERNKVDRAYKAIRKVQAQDLLLLTAALQYRSLYARNQQKLKFFGGQPASVYDFYSSLIEYHVAGGCVLMHLNDFNKPAVCELLKRTDVMKTLLDAQENPQGCPLEQLRILFRQIDAEDRRIRRFYLLPVRNWYEAVQTPCFPESGDEAYRQVAHYLIEKQMVHDVSEAEIVTLIRFRNALLHEHFSLQKKFDPDQTVKPALIRMNVLKPEA